MMQKIFHHVFFPKFLTNINSRSLYMEWEEIPWDSFLLGSTVLQIKKIEIRGPAVEKSFVIFENYRDKRGCEFVSCRLPSDCLPESMLLEDSGFRFVEMSYRPTLESLQNANIPSVSGLRVSLASSRDLSEVLSISEQAFSNERFHVDPRLSPKLGNQRYCNWVKNCIIHKNQQLYVVREGLLLVAFFITEQMAGGTHYWHLNAVAPYLQGQGYGRRAWLVMLETARLEGAIRVESCVAARNYRVLNLYASLGFRFSSPMMAFHWVRQSHDWSPILPFENFIVG